MATSLTSWLSQINHPEQVSRKGQNGKALVIGGSDLFHAASQWSFRAASRWVDMLFYSSVAENNQLIHEAKLAMTDGVVIPRSEIPAYIKEADSILIGPGMRRDAKTRFSLEELQSIAPTELTTPDWEFDTQAVTSTLLRTYPQKTWIIDAGALQVLELEWLPSKAILTPHAGEFSLLLARWSDRETEQKVLSAVARLIDPYKKTTKSSHAAEIFTFSEQDLQSDEVQTLRNLSRSWNNAIILLKGSVDIVFDSDSVTLISGGNAGLTKGGTGDVLAGLILGLSTTSDSYKSAVAGTALMKQSAHDLFEQRQEMFNASDVVEQLPLTFAKYRPKG